MNLRILTITYYLLNHYIYNYRHPIPPSMSIVRLGNLYYYATTMHAIDMILRLNVIALQTQIYYNKLINFKY